MRINDWSSDGCSSDLRCQPYQPCLDSKRSMRRRLSLPAAICNCLGAQGNKSRCRSSPARGGEPPKVVEGNGRGSVDAEGGKHHTCPSTMLRKIGRASCREVSVSVDPGGRRIIKKNNIN